MIRKSPHLPLRPSFWFHVSLEMVEANENQEVPRIHYDEIIDSTIGTMPLLCSNSEIS